MIDPGIRLAKSAARIAELEARIAELETEYDRMCLAVLAAEKMLTIANARADAAERMFGAEADQLTLGHVQAKRIVETRLAAELLERWEKSFADYAPAEETRAFLAAEPAPAQTCECTGDELWECPVPGCPAKKPAPAKEDL